MDAFEEAIVLIKLLSGGGSANTYPGRHYQVRGIELAPVAARNPWAPPAG